MSGSAVEEPEWIEIETVHHLHDLQLAEHGGGAGLRSENLFLSAMDRPRSKWAYGDPPPDICALAASYAYGLAKNHPFIDGNKRTAAVVCETFLILNGVEPTATEEEKYPAYLALAAGEMSEDSFADWLRANTAPVA